jgi:acetylornithine deacetylase/succinyl-diaminopimelate desuccinylase family protein
LNQKQIVFDYLDNHTDELVELMKSLVRIPSINYQFGGDEKTVQDWLAEHLRSLAFAEVDQFAVDADQLRPNVVAMMKGTGGGRSLLFNGHMDVVPIAEPEKWLSDPFIPIQIENRIYGRGTSDMKGGVSAAIWAMKAIKECGIQLKGDVLLQAVTGEESNEAEEIGTVPCLKRGYTADFAVVCEPTDLELHIASSGLFFFELVVEGKAVHISARNQVLFPQPAGVPSGPAVGVDAFKKSLLFVQYFYSLEEQWNHRWRDSILGAGGRPGHDVQGVGLFTINPSFIEGGEYLGSVPGKVKYTYGVWYPDQLVDKEELWEEIRRGVEALSSTDDFLRGHPPKLTVPVMQEWQGFQVDEDHEGVRVMLKAIGDVHGDKVVMSGFRAVCDATYLNKYEVPAVVFGPGSLSWSVHGDNECITVESLASAAKVYASMMMDWCQ